MCTRIVYDTEQGQLLIGRTLDWMEDTATDLWAFPRGMKRTGGSGLGYWAWESRFGSITAALYNAASVDGMNEAGLVGNMLYLAEAQYPDRDGAPGLSIGAWMQYALDSYATVAEAVEGLSSAPFVIRPADMPTGDKGAAHLALTDASGDSAVFEYIEGVLHIHHGRKYTVMTNSPAYDQQLAINTYWQEVGGAAMMPGTYRAADRFVRAAYNLSVAPKTHDRREALGAIFSMARTISVPLGVSEPGKPNIAKTIWRTVSDIPGRRYYFESIYSPAVIWVDLERLDLSKGDRARKLDLQGDPILAGEVSERFIDVAQPYPWLK